ncbi:MAG: hypothetical protein US54_C0048G0007 [Candidatus Roizmanbacteria bacterium GW2011_GWA2_37_7]|uniref:Uncharacterized protein n=1 Tax=Candidatus Roizmanbacteria bacterium GW2011_GWA2_37_7 TaxID=1618481 RepID=A0A0G0H496_9BACT|nr:MAG: hypothetical protein US54_C0048G0007 [Candidatus Roizmanbacteria bacterium GW2011_GWA2_37_7]
MKAGFFIALILIARKKQLQEIQKEVSSVLIRVKGKK